VTSQNHCTLSFSLKSAADAKAVAEQLPLLMPSLFEAEDSIGTVHYWRYTVLSDKTLLFHRSAVDQLPGIGKPRDFPETRIEPSMPPHLARARMRSSSLRSPFE
jgi:hypothetical protein